MIRRLRLCRPPGLKLGAQPSTIKALYDRIDASLRFDGSKTCPVIAVVSFSAYARFASVVSANWVLIDIRLRLSLFIGFFGGFFSLTSRPSLAPYRAILPTSYPR